MQEDSNTITISGDGDPTLGHDAPPFLIWRSFTPILGWYLRAQIGARVSHGGIPIRSELPHGVRRAPGGYNQGQNGQNPSHTQQL